MRLPLESFPPDKPLGVYVHVPFCRQRCIYCDFYSTAPVAPSLVEPFVEAVLAELAFWRSRVDLSAVRTLFVGGGTPTALPADAIESLLRALTRALPALDEFTIEANPATLDLALARRIRSIGANRLSFGAQSFDPADLALLSRLHGRNAIAESMRVARMAGFENVSLDLMLGLPNQTVTAWQANLRAAVDLAADHLSCYGLSYEPGTVLAQLAATGRVTPLSEERVSQMYLATLAQLSASGYVHYEISNWSLPGRACRHNLLYWRNRPWLGVGPSAASYLSGFRFRGVPDVRRYIECVVAGAPDYVDVERLQAAAALGEAIMLALRLREGADLDELSRHAGIDARAAMAAAIDKHLALGTIAWRANRLTLTDAALPVADSVLADFV